MSGTSNDGRSTNLPSAGSIDLKLEVVVIPVSDVDRAKRFYTKLGWRLDADFTNSRDWRVVQFTPPGSCCSVHFGVGLTTTAPGGSKNVYLVVTDIAAARAGLIVGGADVSDPYHFEAPGGPRVPGPGPEGQSYGTFATFSDPDGNSWLLQEVTERLPGRGLPIDVDTLTALLQEAEAHHGEYEASAPKHPWSQWYAAYLLARERGRAPDDAARGAAQHVQELRA